MSKFKVGDKVVGFDGKGGFEGRVRNIWQDKTEIGNGAESIWFPHGYVCPSGTTFEIKEPKPDVKFDSEQQARVQELIDEAYRRAFEKATENSRKKGGYYISNGANVIRFKEPKVRGGRFNRVREELSSCGFIVWYGGDTEAAALKCRERSDRQYDYIGPPIYIEAKEGSAPTTVTIKKGAWEAIKGVVKSIEGGIFDGYKAKDMLQEFIDAAEAEDADNY